MSRAYEDACRGLINYDVKDKLLLNAGFRLIFEDWSHEIDRAINSMRKDLNISEETEILLAGSAGYIQYFDEFIQSETNIKTKFFSNVYYALSIRATFKSST